MDEGTFSEWRIWRKLILIDYEQLRSLFYFSYYFYVNLSAIESPSIRRHPGKTTTFICEKYNQRICKRMHQKYPWTEARLQTCHNRTRRGSYGPEVLNRRCNSQRLFLFCILASGRCFIL